MMMFVVVILALGNLGDLQETSICWRVVAHSAS